MKCPMIDKVCEYYVYQKDRNGRIAICFCSHKENKNNYEGNCTDKLCPLMSNKNIKKSGR